MMNREAGLVHVCIVSLFAVALAGCFAGEEGGAEDDRADGPRDGEDNREARTIEGLRECHHLRATYPGSDIPLVCENTLPEVEPDPDGPPLGWVCVESMGGASGSVFRQYHDPAQERFGFSFQVPDHDWPVSGLVAVMPAEAREYEVWNRGGDYGFIVLPEIAQGDEIHVRFFSDTFESEADAFRGGSFHTNWSVLEETPYPVRVLRVDGVDHYFPSGFDPAAEWDLHGKDFRIKITHVGFIGIHTEAMTVPADPSGSC